MTAAIGEASLSAAVLLAASAVLASVGAIRFGSPRWLRAARWSIGGIALLLTVTAGALVIALVRSDFRFEYVAGHTERALPLGYKLAAFWAGQQGSLLLWAWLLGILCFVATPGLRRLRPTDHAVSVAVLAIVCGFFAALLLFAANPFAMVEGTAPADGRGLNPMLQDPGMIAHPPLLFLGYAGFTVPFAVLVGVLAAGRTDNHWIAIVRRWILASWIALSAGIVLGAWWAYIELGWGGYWAWDPVENASLLPWLTATALLHSMMVQQHRGMFKIWTAALIALTFLLCVFGTYLTRSGVVASVHSFAPSLIATFFLVFIILIAVSGTALILWRRRLLKQAHPIEALISREGAFLFTNMLLLVMMGATLVGTVFPLISRFVLGREVTVGPPFYNRVVAPMALLLAAIMAIGPVLAFGRTAPGKIARSLVVPGLAALAATAAVAIAGTRDVRALACTAIATLGTCAVIVGFARAASARRRSTGEGWVSASVRLIDRDHRRYGGQLTHLGVMMIVIGVAGSSLFSTERIFRLAPGETASMGAYTFQFIGLAPVRAANYTAFEATTRWTDDAGRSGTLRPQCRFYDTWRDEPNTEIALRSTWRHDLYVSVVGWEDGGAVTALQVHINPLVVWIWIGGIVMVAGGLFCMMPRLLPETRRVLALEAAPAEAASPALQPTARALPAESAS